MLFCIFSFNRGRYLANAVDSIKRCAPGSPIAIFDDNSTDPETRRLMDELARQHVVISNRKKQAGRLGGLYSNMQAAMDYSLEAGAETVCFLQDDTQLVRPMTSDDHQHINTSTHCWRMMMSVFFTPASCAVATGSETHVYSVTTWITMFIGGISAIKALGCIFQHY